MDDSEGHQRVLPTQPHPHPGPHEFSHPIFPLFGVFLSIRHLIAYHMPNNAEHRGGMGSDSCRAQGFLWGDGMMLAQRCESSKCHQIVHL